MVRPLAEEYDIRELYLFGSYARGEATENSDIDFLYDKTGSKIHSLTTANCFFQDLKKLFNISVDLVSITAMNNKDNDFFKNIVDKEKVKIYERI